jgi:glycosyltransferase involved in cell wall biosynthesis
VHIYRYALPVDAEDAVGFVAEFLWCFVRTAMKSVRVAVAGRGFDVLHVCNPPETYWPLGRFWQLFGRRFLFDHHDLSPEMYQAKFDSSGGLALAGLRFLERKTFQTADLVITTNQSHRRIAIERGGMAPADVYVVRSGPDLERLTVYPADPAWRKGKCHLVVYLGEICKQDGVDHLIRALKLLRVEFRRDDIHCVLVGGGPHQPSIKGYAEEIGVSDLCTFTGRVSDDDLCRILSSADLGVDPDPKNAWSDKSTMNKIMEYMFFGLPIVAYDLTEHRVSAGPAALFAEPNRERALALRIRELLDDPARLHGMGEAGRERVQAFLAWEHSAPVLLAAYDRLWPTPAGDASPTCSSIRPIRRLAAKHRREDQRRAQGHDHTGGDAPKNVGQRVHRLHQARHGDGERVADRQKGDGQPDARGDGRKPDGQYGGQGHRDPHRGVTRRE